MIAALGTTGYALIIAGAFALAGSPGVILAAGVLCTLSAAMTTLVRP